MVEITCPTCKTVYQVHRVPEVLICCVRSRPQIENAPAIDGPSLWAELHTCQNPSAQWLGEWTLRVQSLVCDCSSKLAKLFEAHPVRFDDWFAWSVELHNAVNETLGKPQVSIDEARMIWNAH